MAIPHSCSRREMSSKSSVESRLLSLRTKQNPNTQDQPSVVSLVFKSTKKVIVNREEEGRRLRRRESCLGLLIVRKNADSNEDMASYS